jgi:hypothetical protein
VSAPPAPQRAYISREPTAETPQIPMEIVEMDDAYIVTAGIPVLAPLNGGREQ